jgi:hypothetical protein
MTSDGENKAKSSEMMDQKAEEAAVGKGSAPELSTSTVLDWMPKERGAAPRVGSRAWPTCTRQKDFSGKMTKKVVYLWAIGRRSGVGFWHPWL